MKKSKLSVVVYILACVFIIISIISGAMAYYSLFKDSVRTNTIFRCTVISLCSSVVGTFIVDIFLED